MTENDYFLILAAQLESVGLVPGGHPTAPGLYGRRPAVCAHDESVPVDSVVTGEILAYWCPTCETQLPA